MTNVGYKVICGLQAPKMFVNFHKSHYFYFIHLNPFFEKGSIGLKRSMVQKVKNHWSKVTVGNHENFRDRMNVTKPLSKQ